jgi:hypothetical protein
MRNYGFASSRRWRWFIALTFLMSVSSIGAHESGVAGNSPATKDDSSVPTQLDLLPYSFGVIGAVEVVRVGSSATPVLARIDTGATTTSMHAEALERFERDGQPWVRFSVPSPAKDGDAAAYELPMQREVTIKRHGSKGQVRPVVFIDLYFGVDGSMPWRGEVSLTDRSAYKYPVLVGRNLLAGHAVVDCGRQGLLAPLPEVAEESN